MTLKEIYQALLDDETLINVKTGHKLRFNNDYLIDETGNRTWETFVNEYEWEIYKDPKEPENWVRKLCWFWDDVEDQKVLGILTNYGRSGQFEMDYDIIYEHCRPATREEVEQYLVKEN